MGDDIDTTTVYKWESSGAASYQSVVEDEHGKIIAINTDRDRSYRAKKQRITQSVKRGLIRYLVIGIDCSESSYSKDFRPCLLDQSINSSKLFIREYFDQNPISQMSIVLTRNRNAERLTELSANPKNHENQISSIQNTCYDIGTGNDYNLASLQQTIALAIRILKHVPDYGHKELLIIYSSLSTCDTDIFTTINDAKKSKIRISIICLAAELHICKKICEETGGTFSVALDSSHFSELLSSQTLPPPEVQNKRVIATDFIYMGFPERTFDSAPSFGFDGQTPKLFSTSYICPNCYTRTTEVPTQCSVCLISLNSSAHIARSTHHLFPVANFLDMELYSENDQLFAKLLNQQHNNEISELLTCVSKCFGCMAKFNVDSAVFKCPKCMQIYCVECDIFIHDSLHKCPGCN